VLDDGDVMVVFLSFDDTEGLAVNIRARSFTDKPEN
jgi:hypothetical protein